MEASNFGGANLALLGTSFSSRNKPDASLQSPLVQSSGNAESPTRLSGQLPRKFRRHHEKRESGGLRKSQIGETSGPDPAWRGENRARDHTDIYAQDEEVDENGYVSNARHDGEDDLLARLNDMPETSVTNPANLLIISNFSSKANESSLTQIFQRFADLVEMKFYKDPHRRRLNGHAYALFSSAREAEIALHAMRGVIFERDPLQVEFFANHTRASRPGERSRSITSIDSEYEPRVHPRSSPVRRGHYNDGDDSDDAQRWDLHHQRALDYLSESRQSPKIQNEFSPSNTESPLAILDRSSCNEGLFVSLTISEDRTGDSETVLMKRLAALNCRSDLPTTHLGSAASSTLDNKNNWIGWGLGRKI